ncbi:MAG: hypothetical protein IJ168_00125 [Eubacterium sp.]|nr:hypothetical protein [Eubacterium sp.]
MSKNEFQKSMELVTPDACMKTRVEAAVQASRKPAAKRRRPIAAAAGLLCAVMVLSVVTASAFGGRVALPFRPSVTESTSVRAPGGILVAYADENGVTQEKLLEGDGFCAGHLYACNISGMTEEEVRQAYKRGCELAGVDEILPVSLATSEYDEFKDYGAQDIIDAGDRIIFTWSNIYPVNDSGCPLRLDADAEQIERIDVSCDSDYLEPEFNNAGAMRFNDSLVFDEALSEVDPFLYGNFTVSGEDYRKDAAVGEKIGMNNMCDFYWRFKEDFETMLNRNPAFDFADADSDIVFTVHFKDGTTAVSTVGVRFEAEGDWITVQLVPVDYQFFN